MASHWIRRAALLGTAAAALLLASCGGGTVASQFTPSRVIAFGDGMGDVGQDGARYTVNDGSVNVWTEYVANANGQPLTPSSQGGLGYAWGNARVDETPDAAGNSSTPTVTQQIDSFLATHTLSSSDMVLVSAGTSDVITQARMALEGSQTSDQMLANLDAAGKALAAQINRLVAAGATHVVVAGPYDLGRSPWAVQMGTDSLLHPASQQFNDSLLVALVNAGANVLYVDAALYYNQQTSSSSNVADHTDLVCVSVDPGPGIGTGNGQVNSHLCSIGTIAPGQDYTQFLFADRVYPTPRGAQLFGDYARGQIHNRW
jgi:phospholipase/lecithinase/hemolysin